MSVECPLEEQSKPGRSSTGSRTAQRIILGGMKNGEDYTAK